MMLVPCRVPDVFISTNGVLSKLHRLFWSTIDLVMSVDTWFRIKRAQTKSHPVAVTGTLQRTTGRYHVGTGIYHWFDYLEDAGQIVFVDSGRSCDKVDAAE